MPLNPNPFSDAALKAAADKVENLPSNQVQLGVTYTQQNGIEAEVEGEKDLGSDGWFVAADATWSQRLKAAGMIAIGWRQK